MAVLDALHSGGTRRELDYYPTPPEATQALLPHIADWPRSVWEPCCGDGAMSKVLEAAGYDVLSTDLVDRGYGAGKEDFFEFVFPFAPYLSVVTNPPFNRADDFIQHACAIGVERMALLLKINFWNAAKRLNAWGTWRPRMILPFTWRLDFTGAGSPHTDCMWVLWDRTNHLTGFDLLRRPA